MIKVEILVEEKDGNAAIQMEAKRLKGSEPTPIEVAAFQEMKARILAKVVEVPKTHQRAIRKRRERGESR